MLVIVNINHLLSGVILPVSLLTATIGGPIFIYVLYQGQILTRASGSQRHV